MRDPATPAKKKRSLARSSPGENLERWGWKGRRGSREGKEVGGGGEERERKWAWKEEDCEKEKKREWKEKITRVSPGLRSSLSLHIFLRELTLPCGMKTKWFSFAKRGKRDWKWQFRSSNCQAGLFSGIPSSTSQMTTLKPSVLICC